jgi:hypothetical protein
MAHHRRRAGIGLGERRKHAHQRGLAGAVGPENREDHAARHDQIDVVDGAQIAEGLDHAARRNRGFSGDGGQICSTGKIVHGGRSGDWKRVRLPPDCGKPSHIEGRARFSNRAVD